MVHTWKYSARGIIWHVRPGTGLLVGDERRIDEKKADFFCLERRTGKVRWRIDSPGDPWWIGIEAVHHGVLFLHGFATPNLPQHRGIIAVDLLTGKTLWEEKEVEFLKFSGDRVVAIRERPAGMDVVDLEIRTGTAHQPGEDGGATERISAAVDGDEEEVRLPLLLEQAAADDPEIPLVVHGQFDAGSLVGPLEVVKQGKYVIFDYYERAEGGTPEIPRLTNRLTVVDRFTREAVFSAITSTEAHAAIPEVFFVQGEMLYYIQERRTLVAVRLA